MLDSFILGVVQGLTEFLPVSSSGHLLLAREFLGLTLENTLTFDVLLHLATLLAILICFWGDIKRIFIDLWTEGLSARSSRLVWAIVVGTIPAVLAGFFLGDWLENTFRNPEYVAYALITGSIIMFLADRVSKEKGGISTPKGFLIGIFQALALIPGISRSGSTISGGLIFGLSRTEAIKFAFLLGIPAILGATAKVFFDFGFNISILQFFNFQSLFGFLAAFLSGLWAVKFLVRYLANHSFTIFIIYRVVLAGVILLLL